MGVQLFKLVADIIQSMRYAPRMRPDAISTTRYVNAEHLCTYVIYACGETVPGSPYEAFLTRTVAK